MGFLDKLVRLRGELKGQSDRPHPVRKGEPRWEPDTPGCDISVDIGGNYGISDPGSLLIHKRLDDPMSYGRSKDDSVVTGWDLQTVVANVRNRIKKVASKIAEG